jgi:Glycosyltransferase family 87
MKNRILRFVALACILAVGVGVLMVIVKNNNAGQRDFITYWVGGQQLVHGADPYDAAAAWPMEKAAHFNFVRPLVMRNPPYAFFLVLPLGFLSPNAGLMFWFIAILVSLVASVRMIWIMNGRPDDRLHLLGYCFAPVMECLMAGQFGIFLLLGITVFLYFQQTKPMLAGAGLLLCAMKPHLFVPFGIVFLLWTISTKAYRAPGGACIALAASTALSLAIDPHAFAQYRQMLQTGMTGEILPTMSEMLRLITRGPIWVRFIPDAIGSAWAVWYFIKRRHEWDWMDQGLVVLLVSVLCSPYSFISDESLLLPAVLTAVYRASNSERSLVPFGIAAGIAMLEVFINIPMTTGYYLWTPTAWLLWYLYATSKKGSPTGEMRIQAANMVV